jgi:hypothetical protein
MSKLTYNPKAAFTVTESGVRPVPGARTLKARLGNTEFTIAMHQRRKLAGGVATERVNGKVIYRWLTQDAARKLFAAGKDVLQA